MHILRLLLSFLLCCTLLLACNQGQPKADPTPQTDGEPLPEPETPNPPNPNPGEPTPEQPVTPNPDTTPPKAEPLVFEFEKQTNAHLTGVWTDIADWPIIAIHMALLPNGDVFSYGTGTKDESNEAFRYDVWTPSLGLSDASHKTLDKQSPTDIFCSGQTLLTSGELLIVGGNLAADVNRGSSDINLYNSSSQSLNKSPLQMTQGRWYPTATTLASGDVLLQAGWNYNFQAVPTPELYKQEGGWQLLTGASNDQAFGDANIFYPWSFVSNTGKVFIAGPDDDSYLLDPTGTGSTTKLSKRGDTIERDYGNAVMFAPNKILVTGGGLPPQKTSFVTDISSDTNPQTSQVASMTHARRQADATLLPTGDVLVTGGSSGNDFNDESNAIFEAELWNPANDTWTSLASASEVRTYHSSALLLPSGAVISAGGGKCDCEDKFNAEVFLPPYLFKKDGSGDLAPRPKITQAPENLSYKQTFTLSLSNTQIENISKVSLLRAGSSTHSWNNDQRFMILDFNIEEGKLKVKAPEKAELAPPGYYLLSVVDNKGVPSVSKIIKLN